MPPSFNLSERQFTDALRGMQHPTGSVLAFLRAHYRASGRALTATLLAQEAGYKNHNALNLQYGRLAVRVGAAAGVHQPNLSLLVDFARPKAVTNEHWLLIMKPAFAEALKKARWV